jgi:hypothetical protein
VRSSAVADRRASLRALDTARSLDRVRATARPGGRDLSSEAPTARGARPGGARGRTFVFVCSLCG